MSRIGKNPITIPAKTDVVVSDGVVTVKGPHGELRRRYVSDVTITVADGAVTVAPARESREALALWGTFASHVRNMLQGVNEPFTKKLEVEGIGYKVDVTGPNVVLNVGYSHPVLLPIPEGIAVKAEKGVITVSGVDKEAVGQFAAEIREVRKPEPYKGKGIHKQGKKAGA
jgi:large subunit ribosomal protein L6